MHIAEGKGLDGNPGGQLLVNRRLFRNRDHGIRRVVSHGTMSHTRGKATSNSIQA
jgi:hypothetical protein